MPPISNVTPIPSTPPLSPSFIKQNFLTSLPNTVIFGKVYLPLNEGGVIYGLKGHTGFTTKITGNPSIVYNFEGICQHVENR